MRKSIGNNPVANVQPVPEIGNLNAGLNFSAVRNTALMAQIPAPVAGPSLSHFRQAQHTYTPAAAQIPAVHSRANMPWNPLIFQPDLLNVQSTSIFSQPTLSLPDYSKHKNIEKQPYLSVDNPLPKKKGFKRPRPISDKIFSPAATSSNRAESQYASLAARSVEPGKLCRIFEKSLHSTDNSTNTARVSAAELPGTSAQYPDRHPINVYPSTRAAEFNQSFPVDRLNQVNLLPSGLEVTIVPNVDIEFNTEMLTFTLHNLLSIADDDIEKYNRFNTIARIMIDEDSIIKTHEKLEKHLQQPDVQQYPVPGLNVDIRYYIRDVFLKSLKDIEMYLPDEVFAATPPAAEIPPGFDSASTDLVTTTTSVADLKKLKKKDKKPCPPHIIKERMIRILGRNFLRSSSNLELVLSGIEKRQQALALSVTGATAGQKLEMEYLTRLKLFLDRMKISFLVIGDSRDDDVVIDKGLPYGPRGLDFSIIHQLVNDPNISIEQLDIFAFYANSQLSPISHTGELNLDALKYLSVETLKMIFNPDNNFNNGIPVYSFARLDEVNLIVSNGYNNGHSYSQLPHFLRWVRDIAFVMGSYDALARMLFDNRAEDMLSLHNIAQIITDKNNNVPGAICNTDIIIDEIIKLCRERAESGNYPEVRSQTDIINNFNQLKLEDILQQISKNMGISILWTDNKHKLGHYDAAGTYHAGGYPQGWHLVLTAKSVYRSDIAKKHTFKPVMHQGSHHSILQALLTSFYSGKLPKKRIELDVFHREIIIIHQLTTPDADHANAAQTAVRPQ